MLTRQGTSEPLWNATDAWTPSTVLRQFPDSRVAILTLGAPSYLAAEAADQAALKGASADVIVINGFPLAPSFFADIASRYARVITIEDGLIGTVDSGPSRFCSTRRIAVVSHSSEAGSLRNHGSWRRSLRAFREGVGALWHYGFCFG